MHNLRKFFFNLKTNYWLIPAILLILITVFTLALINIDINYDHHANYIKWLSWYDMGPLGARELFGVIATSTITVTTLIFSITILAVSQASNQISPRLLAHFMSNRFTQITLGLIAGIFIYCILVLVAIHTGKFIPEFVPKLATIFGIILSILGVFFLVAFIYHIVHQLQAAVIIARISKSTLKSIERTFPKQEQLFTPEVMQQDQDELNQNWIAIPSNKTGYIQDIDYKKLSQFAVIHNLTIKLEHDLGGFLVANSTLLFISDKIMKNEECIKKLNRFFIITPYRRIYYDPAFGVQQLSDITIKALTVGINDLTTAITAIDYLTIVLSDLANRNLLIENYNEAKNLKLTEKQSGFEKYCGIVFNQIRQNAKGHVTIITRLVHAIRIIAELTQNQTRKQILLHHLNSITTMARETVVDANDLEMIETRAKKLREILA